MIYQSSLILLPKLSFPQGEKDFLRWLVQPICSWNWLISWQRMSLLNEFFHVTVVHGHLFSVQLVYIYNFYCIIKDYGRNKSFVCFGHSGPKGKMHFYMILVALASMQDAIFTFAQVSMELLPWWMSKIESEWHCSLLLASIRHNVLISRYSCIWSRFFIFILAPT